MNKYIFALLCTCVIACRAMDSQLPDFYEADDSRAQGTTLRKQAATPVPAALVPVTTSPQSAIAAESSKGGDWSSRFLSFSRGTLSSLSQNVVEEMRTDPTGTILFGGSILAAAAAVLYVYIGRSLRRLSR